MTRHVDRHAISGRGRSAVVVVVVASVLLAGCTATAAPTGPSAPGSVSATSPSPVTPSPVTPSPVFPGEPATVGPMQIDATNVPGGYTGPTTLDGAGLGLTLTATESGCTAASAELVGQDAVRVAVRLVLTRTSAGVCSTLAQLVALTVQLAAPLGTRTVVLSQQRR